jgi:hypothetical protein
MLPADDTRPTDVWRLTYNTGGDIGIVWGYDEEDATRELNRILDASPDADHRVREEGGWCMEAMTAADVLSWAVAEHRAVASSATTPRAPMAVALYARAAGITTTQARIDVMTAAAESARA